ncbi:SPRY domain-containing SOCS box protein 3 [Echinococcus granulosus]|nr:SPRY domain-containing SOCS box protein 3 [Echinococcus granulosus]
MVINEFIMVWKLSPVIYANQENPIIRIVGSLPVDATRIFHQPMNGSGHNLRTTEGLAHYLKIISTAVVRGSELLSSGIHYWELKVISPVYGTDMMFGIGLADVCLTTYRSRFVPFLGLDNKTWGLGYRGQLQHNKHFIHPYGASFTRGDLVGCLLDLWHRKLTFFVNRMAITDPIPLPLGSYYPMACSTAARSGFRIIFSKSYDISLQLLTLLSLKTALGSLSTIFDLPAFPPSLLSFYQNSTPWVFHKSHKRQRIESHLFPEMKFKLRRLSDVSIYTHFILLSGWSAMLG